MDLRHLRYFQAVAEELSFTRAAGRLHIAQPALSRAVQELEREIGVSLIDRSQKAIRLTPGGTLLLRECANVFDVLEETLRRVRQTAAGQIGELRLGYIGPPTRDFLGPLLRAYRDRHPDVTLVLEERTPERVWEMVAKGKLSVGLTRPVTVRDAHGLCSLLLRQETLCVAVFSGHPWFARDSVQWAELADQRIVLLARREGVGSHETIVAACAEAGFTPRIVQTPSLIGTILRYVEAGTGVGIVPESVVPEIPSVRLLRLLPDRTIPLVLVWPPGQEDPPAAAFRILVQEWISAPPSESTS